LSYVGLPGFKQADYTKAYQGEQGFGI